jgi:predicted site-specific integrase-resolvase
MKNIMNMKKKNNLLYNLIDEFAHYGYVIMVNIMVNKWKVVNDLMMIIASFSGRLYVSRSAKRRKEQKLKENSIIN